MNKDSHRAIAATVAAARRKHPVKTGQWPHSVYEQIAVLAETVGEVSGAMLDMKYHQATGDCVRTELLHVAAVVVRMLEGK